MNQNIFLWYDRNYVQTSILNLHHELAQVTPGMSYYPEEIAIFGAVSANGNLRYRQIPITVLVAPQVPVYMILMAAGVIALVVIISVTVIAIKKRQASS